MKPTEMSLEPEAQSGEDFVHVDEPKPHGDFSLSDSIVNVEKEELLRDVEEKEEEHSDSGLVTATTGDDPIGDSVISGVGEPSVEKKKKKLELPEELAKNVMVLTCESTEEGGSCDVFLVGTAHVSQESCREVEAVVSYLKPQVVFVELCASRLSVLNPQALQVPTLAEMVEMWKQNHTTFGILYSWFLAKIASQLEVFPGAEFRVAYEEATKYGGKVILGDRPVQITLKRTWAKMPLRQKVKLMYNLVSQAIFLPKPKELQKLIKDMDDGDMVTLKVQEMSKEFPSLMDTLIHERDKYMSSFLLGVASEHSSVVAVVGKGHLQGIKKNWNQPIKMKELLEIPTNESIFTVKKVMKSLAVVVAGTAIVSGIYLGSRS